ncbi:MAG: hypothetical protein KC593_04320 [Myxococcales bacterium]|nr:hypothetical protein [Myxococcales bacterium]
MDNKSRLVVLVAAALVGVVSCDDSPTDVRAPTEVGVVRSVPVTRVEDPSEWGAELELALEAEFWDLITNSDHEAYPAWDAKVVGYQQANPDAPARLELLRTAGAVFQTSQAFGGENVDTRLVLQQLPQIIGGAARVHESLPYHLPAQVFYHNNTAMRGLMLGPAAEGVDHLAQLVTIPGSEGRAAAPFTYGMIDDDVALQYAIDLNEGCDTFVCNWTSRIAPFKPIGQLLMLAELYAIAGDMDAMSATLDRADALAVQRGWPFRDRIVTLREVLPTRTYESGASHGVGVFRWPMPFYANEVNCSNCHVGGRAGTSGQSLEEQYEGHYVTTPTPDPVDLSHLTAP